MPSDTSVTALAVTLDFPNGFFFGPPLDALPLGVTSFRSLSSLTGIKRDQALSAGVLAVELSDWIAAEFDLPAPDVPKYDGLAPEMAAEAVREEWGLGERPIANMIHLLESRGVRVLSLSEEGRALDAFSLWRSGVPFVFLNTMKTGEHSRFDAAHELGHLCLHWRPDVLRGREAERDANRFAAAFLMPQGELRSTAPKGARKPSDLLKAKAHWKVSLAALVYRMHQIGMLNEYQYRWLFVEISRAGRENEPNPCESESSQVMAKVFQELRREGMTQSDLARNLRITTSELSKLVFGLVLTPV